MVRKFTNWWNVHRCIPKAVQRNEDFVMDGEVTAWMDGDLFFTEMVPQEYLQNWLGFQLAACCDFVQNLRLAMALGFDDAG